MVKSLPQNSILAFLVPIFQTPIPHCAGTYYRIAVCLKNGHKRRFKSLYEFKKYDGIQWGTRVPLLFIHIQDLHRFFTLLLHNRHPKCEWECNQNRRLKFRNSGNVLNATKLWSSSQIFLWVPHNKNLVFLTYKKAIRAILLTQSRFLYRI